MDHKKQEMMESVYEEYGYRCFVCGKPANQLAHILGNRKDNKSKYGLEIINNPMNLLPACSLKCNALIDIGLQPEIAEFISFAIMHKNDYIIVKTVRENIDRKLRKLDK